MDILPILKTFADEATSSTAGWNSVAPWLVPVLILIATTVITTLTGLVVTRIVNKHFKKRDEDDALLRERLQELEKCRDARMRNEQSNDTKAIVDGALAPINDKLDLMMDKISKTEEGTLSSLRNDILTCYYRCLEKGYRGDWDFENIHHLFEAYTELHGNSFVADVIERFDALPTKEEHSRQAAEKQKRTIRKKTEG